MTPAMLRSLRGAAILALLLIVAPAARGPVAQEAEAPMTDEDVVRMHVSGTSEESILERVRGADVAFDLSEEMLDELRAAGLSETLIRAMRERQQAVDAERAAPAEPERAQPLPGPRLIVRLNPDWKPTEERPRPVLSLWDTIEPPLREALRLRESQPRFTDAALVLACRTQDHVPDHWRSETPLGRDFINTPRHKLLVFLPGAVRKEAGRLRGFAERLATVPGEREGVPPPGLLELELPAEIEVELEPGVVHDLTLGVALQTEGRYYLVAADSWDGFILPATGASIDAEIDGGRNHDAASVTIRFRRSAAGN